MARKIFFLVLFVALFALVCHLLASSLLGRLFYPLHYREHIFTYADQYQVDPLLVAAVIYTESGFRVDAVSERGARGLMQVMPATAEWVAQRIGYDQFSADMLFDPQLNIQIGTWYMANLLEQFNGNELIALAAYNGGRSQISHWLEQGTWDGSEAELAQIPFGETRNFIRRVLRAYEKYNEIYGATDAKEKNRVYGNLD